MQTADGLGERGGQPAALVDGLDRIDELLGSEVSASASAIFIAGMSVGKTLGTHVAKNLVTTEAPTTPSPIAPTMIMIVSTSKVTYQAMHEMLYFLPASASVALETR